MDSKPIAVIFFAESFSCPEVAWSLSDRGFQVIAAARRHSHAAIRVSRHATTFDVTSPELDAAATVADLEGEIKRLLKSSTVKVALLPLDDAALWVCNQLTIREQLIVVGPPDVSLALDKEAQIAVARKAGFNIPETITIRSGDCVPSPTCGFPLILKPLRSISLNRGKLTKGPFKICRDDLDFNHVIRDSVISEPMLAQQYISGIGEGLFGLALQNAVAGWSSHQRIRMMNPIGSGASACVSIAARLDDLEAGARFVEISAWRGPFMIELLRDEDGKTWFMEFNGRIWGSTALARRCGLEYPAWAVQDALGTNLDPPIPSDLKLGTVSRHAGREAMHGLFVLRGSRTDYSRKWPSKWKTLFQLLRLRKSEHWYNWRSDDWRVFVRDFGVTIADNIFKKRSHKQS